MNSKLKIKNAKWNGLRALFSSFFIFHFSFFIVGRVARADEFDTLRLKWRDMVTQGTNASAFDPLYSPWITSLGSMSQSYWNSMSPSAGRTNLWSAYPNPATDSWERPGVSWNRLLRAARISLLNPTSCRWIRCG